MSWAGRASEAEFRYRFYFLAAIYFAGFAVSGFEHRPTAVWLAEKLAGSLRAAPGRAELRVLLLVAALLAVAAAGLRTWAAAYLNSQVVHDPRLHGERLVADGPYRYLRNPLYLGGVLLALAFGAYASPLGLSLLLIGHVVFYARLIAREEEQLARTQGEDFLEYRRRIPALWPAWRPRLAASGARPAWAQAWAGEMLMWLFAAALLLTGATLNFRLLWPAVAAAFLLWFVLGRGFRRGRAAIARGQDAP